MTVTKEKNTRKVGHRVLTTFKLEREVTSHSGSAKGEVEDNTEKWGDFWEMLMVINGNIVLRPF